MEKKNINSKRTTIQDKSVKTKEVRHGIPMSVKSLAEYEQTWKDIEDCINDLNKNKNRYKEI